ncbi:hypothetical protein K7I13_06515 [Brucepastera parasyntrophica]|uniref:hypothetical protein n=1 Tax=Brucepastera parasyntrophica TaxID=2880008 RepID=UPI0021098595|nr:hypothetical protein [Brucepastera parasyntrophica]ULQ60908.1 hypothetical protein K7I13_06515 [Brucepastera parasyntrophica]
MATNVLRRIILLTVLYLCIIFGIFAIQFTNSNAFTLSIGTLLISGSQQAGENGLKTPLLPVHFTMNGVDFFLDDQRPLLAYGASGTAVPLSVISFRQEDNSFIINFSEDTSVTFSVEKRNEADVLALSARMPAKYQKIAFPFRLMRNTSFKEDESPVKVTSGKKQYVFLGTDVLPQTSSNQNLQIFRSSPVVYYQTYIPAMGVSIEEIAGLIDASEEKYNSSLSRFADNALVSFRESVAAGHISEPIAAAYLAEMGKGGEYLAGLRAIPEAFLRSSDRTWLTNPFLGGLERTWAGYITRSRDTRAKIASDLRLNNGAVFQTPELIPYLINASASGMITDLLNFTPSFNTELLTARQAAGVLEAMMDMAYYLPGRENVFVPLTEKCEKKLQDSLVLVQNKLFISDNTQEADTIETFNIADILIRYGSEYPGKEDWRHIGYYLVNSLLDYSGDRAALPMQFILSSGTGQSSGPRDMITQHEQMLPPSELYSHIITGSTWYPHAVNLSKTAGAGIWAWTIAQSVTAEKPEANILSLQVRFPLEHSHYMVISGVKPFYRIQIGGIDFRTDPRFETYNSSGYRYNERTETLYLKLRHRTEITDVVLYMGNPPAPAPEPAPPAVPEQAAPEEVITVIEPANVPAPLPGSR